MTFASLRNCINFPLGGFLMKKSFIYWKKTIQRKNFAKNVFACGGKVLCGNPVLCTYHEISSLPKSDGLVFKYQAKPNLVSLCTSFVPGIEFGKDFVVCQLINEFGS